MFDWMFDWMFGRSSSPTRRFDEFFFTLVVFLYTAGESLNINDILHKTGGQLNREDHCATVVTSAASW